MVDADPVVGFKRHVRAVVIPDDALYLFSEDSTIALQGADFERLAPLLDGTRDLAGLWRDLPADIDRERIAGALTALADRGLIYHGPAIADAGEPVLAFWDSTGVDTAKALEAKRRVGLITVGVAPDAAAETLTAAGIAVDRRPGCAPGTADLSVVLCEDYLAAGLAEVDSAHRRAGRPWLLARPFGARVWLGPVFTPGNGPCWQCLATRLWGNRPAEAYVHDALGLAGSVSRPAAGIAPLTAIALNLVALEAVKWLAGHRYPGQRKVWTLDARDLAGEHHEVRARPQCPACGDPELMRGQARQPIVLSSRPKAYATGGGHRARPPEDTLARYRHLVDPVTGLVPRIQRDPHGPAFLNSFRSGPNRAFGARGARQLRSAVRYENGGKGATPLEAEVGALCEALERHSSCLQGDELLVRSTLRALGEQAVHPDTCQLFHRRQFAERGRWNAEHSAFQYVCDPFDEEAALDWTPVWSLSQQRHRFLPTGLLYLDVPVTPGRVGVLADSNGNAAGTSLEDAVLQGMLEIVERDAVAIWWYNRTRQPGVELDSFGDPWFTAAREVHAELGRELWVLDVTSDLGIPTMAAVSRRTSAPRETIMFGFGAHLDPAIAVRRAVTELNQLLPAVLAESTWDGDPDAGRWWNHATVDNQPYLLPDRGQPARRPGDYRYRPTADLAADVRTVQGRLEDTGHEVLVLNHTRPDIGLPTVKVIVPGMRSFWARFAPGRLYTVPVELGRLHTQTRYEELNPFPIFI